MAGRLVVVPTPIGNLGDITQRALDALRSAEFVFAEDTRRTGLLLQHFGISSRLRSLFLGNERERSEEALSLLRAGHAVALVSDAGTPGISDPGSYLIAAAIREGCPVEVLPGAQAILPALLLSGLPPAPFTFVGFLPRRHADRVRALAALRALPWTIVAYEAPHRLAAMLRDVLEVLGDRPAAISRELTKLHEETVRGSVGTLLQFCEGQAPRGEITVVIGGAEVAETTLQATDLAAFVREATGRGMSAKETADAARKAGFARRAAYQEAILETARRERPRKP